MRKKQIPLNHDLVDDTGRKLAGAGQRRTQRGLQGSVALAGESFILLERSKCLAAAMAVRWGFWEFHPPEEVIAAKVAERYGLTTWTARRP